MASAATSSVVAAARASEYGSPEHKTIQLPHEGGEHTMAYKEYAAAGEQDGAAAETVICVHGLTRNSSDFDALAAHLADKGYRVLSVDIVGRGDSEYLKDTSKYGYPQYVQDMIVFVNKLGLKQVHWVGTSMGGLIGTFIAATPMDKRGFSIATLVLNDIGPFLKKEALQRIVGYVGDKLLFDSIEDMATEFKRRFKPFGPMTSKDWDYLVAHSVAEEVVETDDGPVTKFRPSYDVRIAEPLQATPITEDMNLWAFYNAIDCGCLLLLHGAESDLLSSDVANKMVTPEMTPKVAGSRMVVHIPGVGHAPTIVDPLQIKLVRRFLQVDGGKHWAK